MDITALSMAPIAVQWHVGFAILAVILGPIALFRKRRDAIHKVAGRIWVLAMLGLSGSSFWIQTINLIGPFSPIHILSVVTLIGLFVAVRAIRAGDYLAHGRAMRALYMQALIGAGVFTFLPDRRMNALMGGDNPQMVFVLATLIGTLAIVVIWFHPTLSRALGRRIPLFNGKVRG